MLSLVYGGIMVRLALCSLLFLIACNPNYNRRLVMNSQGAQEQQKILQEVSLNANPIDGFKFSYVSLKSMYSQTEDKTIRVAINAITDNAISLDVQDSNGIIISTEIPRNMQLPKITMSDGSTWSSYVGNNIKDFKQAGTIHGLGIVINDQMTTMNVSLTTNQNGTTKSWSGLGTINN